MVLTPSLLSDHQWIIMNCLEKIHNIKYDDFIVTVWLYYRQCVSAGVGVDHWKHMSVINESIQVASLGSLQERKVLGKHLTSPTLFQPLSNVEKGSGWKGRCLIMEKEPKGWWNMQVLKITLRMQDEMPKNTLFLCLFSLEMGIPKYSKEIKLKWADILGYYILSCVVSPKQLYFF